MGHARRENCSSTQTTKEKKVERKQKASDHMGPRATQKNVADKNYPLLVLDYNYRAKIRLKKTLKLNVRLCKSAVKQSNLNNGQKKCILLKVK
jgi:hypothetical protein